jgi:hypothetical protein
MAPPVNVIQLQCEFTKQTFKEVCSQILEYV